MTGTGRPQGPVDDHGGARARLVLREDELVVGHRVVIRHRLPDGSASDALGELLAADEGGLVVATRRGSVTVRRGDVLAAKAVPPPPPRRGAPHRTVSLRDLELLEHGDPSTPAIQSATFSVPKRAS